MAHKTARFEPFQRAGTIPRPLIVRVKHVAGGIRPDAARAAHAGASRDDFAGRSDLQAPPAKGNLGGKRSGQTEDRPDIAVAVRPRAESIFMVVADDAPPIRDVFKLIGAAVPIGIPEPFDSRAVGDGQGAVSGRGYSEDFVQAARKESPFRLRRLGIGALDDPNFPPAGADGQSLAGEKIDAPGLDDGTRRHGQRDQRVGHFFPSRIGEGSGTQEQRSQTGDKT